MATTLRQHDQHSFLILPENQLAVAAIKRLAPLTRRRTLQTVSLFGPPGTGKSRLARELIRSWEAKRSDGKIVCVTGSEFAAQLAQASTEEAIHQFQSRYRKDVLLFVCEDLQSLSGRKETQQQLTAAIDDVVSTGGLRALDVHCDALWNSLAFRAFDEPYSGRIVCRCSAAGCQ